MIAAQLSQLDKTTAKGLCFEFILHEYAKALTIASKLGRASAQDALDSLEKLIPDSLNRSSLLQPGIVDKLCFYCEVLVQTSKRGEELLDALDVLRNTISLYQAKVSRESRGIFCSDKIICMDALKEKISTFFTLLAPHLQANVECEAALFALLELRTTLNSHLGANCVENLLQKMFPEGPGQFRQVLSSGFAKRGFDDFCHQHEALFEELAWQSTS